MKCWYRFIENTNMEKFKKESKRWPFGEMKRIALKWLGRKNKNHKEKV
jgi:hypothetical protein